MRRRVCLDDIILVVGFLSLIAATVIFYERARTLYLIFGLSRNDEIITLIASQEISTVYNQLNWSFGYTTTLWTTIFSVKLCCFVFFRTLMPLRLVRYYWVAVALTITAWIYLVLQPLISCPYFGESSCKIKSPPLLLPSLITMVAKCFPHLPISEAVMNFTFWTGPILDALTDAARMSEPAPALSITSRSNFCSCLHSHFRPPQVPDGSADKNRDWCLPLSLAGYDSLFHHTRCRHILWHHT